MICLAMGACTLSQGMDRPDLVAIASMEEQPLVDLRMLRSRGSGYSTDINEAPHAASASE